jgi:hypothetical protein
LNGKGNGCGHNPDEPRWFAPPGKHKERPKLLIRLIQEIRRYFRAPAETIPSLNLANGSDRQQRSERREACIALLACIVHYTDLTTLRVGVPQADGAMAGIPMASKDLDGGLRLPGLAELSGLGQRRAERAIRDLKAAGLITVHPLCERLDEATYKGFAAIRALSAKLFDLFGLGGWLKHERRKAAERREKRMSKRDKRAQAKIALASAGANANRVKPKNDNAGQARNAGGRLKLASEYIEIMRNNLASRGPPK